MSDISSTTSTPSGMTGAGGGQLLRITGMASGLDVDAMVKKMMIAEQSKIDKAKQDQQAIQWKQDAYQGIIKDIKDLQSSFFDTGSSDTNILSSTNFSPFTVSGVGTSTVDTSVATFTPGVGAQTGTYSIHVKQLAAGAGVSNTVYAPSTQTTTKATLSTKLTDIGSLSGSIQLALKVGTSDVNVTLDNTDGNSTLGDLVNAINNQGGGLVKASFSELTGGFKLNTTTTGTSSSLTINSGTTASLSSILGEYTVGTVVHGQNADVTITPPGETSGVNVTNQSTNNFTIDGMNYNLSSLSSDPTNPSSVVSVNVGSDTQKVYDKIKSFIDKYNTIVDEIQTKIDEKKDNNYQPLTDAQKSSMSDSQITAWETKAKVGILRNDDNLSKLLNDLRTAFTTAVNNAGFSFGSYGSNSIGLDTSKTDYTKPAHIYIVDSSKLKAAISSSSDQILKMFTNVSAATDGETNYDSSTTQYKEDGIFTRIKRIFENNAGNTNVTLNSAILTKYANYQDNYSLYGGGGNNTLPDQLYQQTQLLKKLNTEFSDQQEKYYKQFSALETALTQLNSQQSMLSQLGM
ncbi:MAG: flagellar filament capping protein FliD [Clostridium sp.]|uniref:flagellar filament capping protein FliD n=1 Tax=Clostridium sp. TaxID=1506 RepID=UPI0039EA47DB